jgi:NodT family efflux transporter outer membrane factor (OMF) lipoprotein
LKSVVKQALAANPSLEQAAARLRSAKARALRSGAELFPDLASRVGSNQDFTRAGAQGIPLEGWSSTKRYDLELNLSWEIDLWGRLRDAERAAGLDAAAAEADFHAARLSLAINTAKAWCDAVEAAQLVALAQSTVVTFEKSLESIASRINNGVPGVTALDEKLSQGNLENARNRQAQAQRRLDTAKRALETLLGKYPAATVGLEQKLPTIIGSVPAGLPSELLLRRPDLRAAEFRAAAEQKRLQAAWKSFLPAFRLTGSGGTSSPELAQLLDAKQLAANLAQGLTQPIFRGGRLLAEVEISRADRDALAAAYTQSALQAFQEVETALAGESYLLRQLEALRRYETISGEAESMAQQNYENAQVTFITVLEAQRRSVEAKEALIQAENARLQNRLNLYLALGGSPR